MTTHNTPDKQGEALVAHEVAAIKRRMLYLQNLGASDCGLTPWSVLRLITTIETDHPRASVAAPEGISWSALLGVLERLRSKNKNPEADWYNGWNAAIQCLINDISSRAAASSSAATEPPPDKQLQSVADRVNAGVAQMDQSQKVGAATMQIELGEPVQPTGEQEKRFVSEVDQWKHDLTSAGWIAESSFKWRAPDGSLWRGPAGAWKELQRRQANPLESAVNEIMDHFSSIEIEELPERRTIRAIITRHLAHSLKGDQMPSTQQQFTWTMNHLLYELTAYLDTLTITSDNIGDVRRSLFVPWESRWNGIVREQTAERERSSDPADHPSPALETPVSSRVISAMANVLSCAYPANVNDRSSSLLITRENFDNLAEVHRELTEGKFK